MPGRRDAALARALRAGAFLALPALERGKQGRLFDAPLPQRSESLLFLLALTGLS
jgi:hypothetical protein